MGQGRRPRAGGNLPGDVTSFVGRRHEVAAARQRMEASRLVTLVGPGGVGKTRLALRVAAESSRAFVDGAWLVDLASVADPAQVGQQVVAALGVRDQSARPAAETLGAFLRDRRLLLVLDNCEHVLDATGQLAASLLREAARLHILATSREALGIEGEHLLEVPPLSTPDGDGDRPAELEGYESVSLLVDRARAVRPAFAVTDANRQAVARLCARLDGIPLAIELAALRLRSLSVGQVVDRMDDRFTLLNRGSRDADPRHRSLRALIGWSYELCSPEEQALWARLSVFPGTFDLAAAEAVCVGPDLAAGAIADLLDHLVAKSVVTTEGDEVLRYRLPVMMREYGARLLGAAGKTDALRRAHRDHYLRRAEGMVEAWPGRTQVAELAAMRADQPNVRAALEWSMTAGEAAVGAGMAATLRYQWVAGGLLGEGRRWLDQALDAVGPGPARHQALWVAAWVCLLQGDHAVADRRLAELAAVCARGGTGLLASHTAQWTATAEMFAGRAEASIALFERAVAGFEAAGDVSGRLTATFELGVAAAFAGRSGQARTVLEEGLELSADHGERWNRMYLQWAAGMERWCTGAPGEAAAWGRAAVALAGEFGDGLCAALTIELLAWVASATADHEAAAQLLGAGAAVWAEIGTTLHAFGPHFEAHGDRAAATTRETLGDARFARHHAAGAALAFDQAVALAAAPSPADSPTVPAPVPATSDGVQEGGLTRREREVAGLIAGGLSNRAIAEKLVLSPRTVENHVARMLTKLGFESRAQIAAWVAAR